MIIFLIAVVVLLAAAMIYLHMAFYREKRLFEARLESMRQVIAEITLKQSGQSGKIRLYEELNEKLKAGNAALGQDILGLNLELFDLLYKNKLLGK